MRRRPFFATLPVLAARPTRAQEAWPGRGITVLVGVAPGGTADLAARLLATHLSQGIAAGRPVVVENKPGAATQLATAELARSAPDGHTLLVAGAPFAINPGLFPRLPYDSRADFAPVAMLVRNGLILMVPANLPARDVPGLLALARSRGGINLASAGNGSMSHLAIEILAQRSGAPLTHVPYRGTGPALPDLIAGNVEAMFDNPSSALPLVREGKLRALAYTGEARSPAAPDIPTLSEATGMPGLAAENWFGLFARAGTPAPILDRLNATVRAMLEQPAIAERLRRDGTEPAPMARADFAAFIAREMDDWAGVIRERGIQPG
ncbi:tripartite tricarboxylate transporter substrate binding protein [Roseomonas sp. KE2513]|uniref:Bug family tripartite tricarboxylate transporter substrate binding protein n=1 Tax=Roseomonas sp. KE2513 TaxID=2479202 RepID=UPI0018E00333|nr:tripartite tricarboxylate transporter substrate binding protein [Roseomonas sp. KE2513]MBI0535952.1 tripartite tricarboxylate transporter substrate binding protein [Roseomonas sp. KE2513]